MKNIISLTKVEKETFFPDGRYEALEALLSPSVYVDPSEITDEEWQKILKENEPEVLVAAWATQALPEDCVESIPSLKYVCYVPGSIRKLVPRSTIEGGLKVTNWGGSISRTVSENALLLILCCMRRVAHWQQEMHNRAGWKDRNKTTTQSLFERRVGLHGFGLISQQLVPLLKPFTDEIYAYSPSVPDSVFEEMGVKRSDSLEELFSENDVVVELASLTDRNYKIVTEELLRSMPDGAAFVNVGRGLVVDEEALARVASEKEMQVGLDVYGIEPLPADSPFRGMDNVTLLPHLGGPTTDRRKDAGDLALEYVKEFKETADVKDAISLAVYDRST